MLVTYRGSFDSGGDNTATRFSNDLDQVDKNADAIVIHVGEGWMAGCLKASLETNSEFGMRLALLGVTKGLDAVGRDIGENSHQLGKEDGIRLFNELDDNFHDFNALHEGELDSVILSSEADLEVEDFNQSKVLKRDALLLLDVFEGGRTLRSYGVLLDRHVDGLGTMCTRALI